MSFINDVSAILHMSSLIFLILVMAGIEVVKFTLWVIAILKTLDAFKNGCLLTFKALRAVILFFTGICTGGATTTITTVTATPTTAQPHWALEEDEASDEEVEGLILTDSDLVPSSSEEDDKDAEDVEEMLVVPENDDDSVKIEEQDQPGLPSIQIESPSDDETSTPPPAPSAPVLRRSPRGHAAPAPAPSRTRTKRAATASASASAGPASAKPAKRQTKKAKDDASTSGVAKKSARQCTTPSTDPRARGESA